MFYWAGPLTQVLGGCDHSQLWMRRYKDRYIMRDWLWSGIWKLCS